MTSTLVCVQLHCVQLHQYVPCLVTSWLTGSLQRRHLTDLYKVFWGGVNSHCTDILELRVFAAPTFGENIVVRAATSELLLHSIHPLLRQVKVHAVVLAFVQKTVCVPIDAYRQRSVTQQNRNEFTTCFQARRAQLSLVLYKLQWLSHGVVQLLLHGFHCSNLLAVVVLQLLCLLSALLCLPQQLLGVMLGRLNLLLLVLSSGK
mmetsp:Transcript_5883/g.9561  ORF Transcript_5883/g.9561 Transcript_5883/m.9561 type:complete len:204 (+) Transcript_5883:633-1244(+)